MKYYAVTDDPRELYHYGVKGMKWGKHIFGDKPKSPGYHRAVKKLKDAAKRIVNNVKSGGKIAQKTDGQKSYNARAKQENRLNKSIWKAQNELAKSDIKYDNWKKETAAKDLHKAIKKIDRKIAADNFKRDATKALASAGSALAKTSGQVAYNIRRAQEDRFNKSIQKADAKLARADAKFDAWQNKIAAKDLHKAIKKIDRKIAADNFKRDATKALASAGSAIAKTPGQVSYNVRRAQENRYQKSVQQAQKRNELASALGNLDREEKQRKQLNREQKMQELHEKQMNIRADNDIKAMKTAISAEKHMPHYYQQAREGTLRYGKLSDEQVARLQDRLGLEYNTRRLGRTEEQSWSAQKKAARRRGYLEGISKGTSAAMEEVSRAAVQYGVKGLANKRKLDKASENKAQREKEASRIKNRKTHSEMREDLKDEAYEAQLKAGVRSIQRRSLSAREASRQLQYANRVNRERQNKINDANEERKFLMEEKHNAIRNERQRQERLAEAEENRKRGLIEAEADADRIGKSLKDKGYALVPSYTKDGKRAGVKILTADGNSNEVDKQGKSVKNDGPAYLKLYESKYGKDSEQDNKPHSSKQHPHMSDDDRKARDQALHEMADQKRLEQLQKEREEHRKHLDELNARHIASEKRRQELKELATKALAREKEEQDRIEEDNRKRLEEYNSMIDERNRKLEEDVKKNRKNRSYMEAGQRRSANHRRKITYRPIAYSEDIFGNRHRG